MINRIKKTIGVTQKDGISEIDSILTGFRDMKKRLQSAIEMGNTAMATNATKIQEEENKFLAAKAKIEEHTNAVRVANQAAQTAFEQISKIVPDVATV